MYMSSYIQDLQHAQARVISLCEENLREKDSQHITEYPRERTVFENGAYVLAEHRHNALRRGPKSKLLPFLRGPLLVKSHNEQGTYVLQDIVSQQTYDYHVSKLRHFQFAPTKTKPLDIAVTDLPDEFVVQECLGYRGNPRGPKSLMEFKRRGVGEGAEEEKWEIGEWVREKEVVGAYLEKYE